MLYSVYPAFNFAFCYFEKRAKQKNINSERFHIAFVWFATTYETLYLFINEITIFLADQNHSKEASGGSKVEELWLENIWFPSPLQRR